jgi:toxin ParE1/3/4
VKLRIHPAAEKELKEAARWYERRRTGLGQEFFLVVDAAMARIEMSPHIAPRLETWQGEGDLRRVVLPKFPYVIVFEVIDDIVHVWSIGHDKRRPGYWQTRRPNP